MTDPMLDDNACVVVSTSDLFFEFSIFHFVESCVFGLLEEVVEVAAPSETNHLKCHPMKEALSIAINNNDQFFLSTRL